METQTPTNRFSTARIVTAVLILLPVIAFSVLLLIAVPDLETWLKIKTEGFSRHDAFKGLTGVAPVFAFVLGATSLVAAYFVITHKSQYLLPMSAGPLFGIFSYLPVNGLTDPEWCALVALLTIGMMVATPVTILLAVRDRKVKVTDRSNGDAVGRTL